MCPHGGPIMTIPSAPRVFVAGMPVATLSDQYLVAGCAFTVPPGKPQPCFRVQWLTTTARCVFGGAPAITQASTGLCISVDGIPNGPPIVTSTQPRASAL